MSSHSLSIGFVVLAGVVSPLVAVAQDVLPKEVAADRVLAAPAADTPQGWALKLTVGATGSYGHSRSVVGAVDGSTVQLGLLVNGSANLRFGQSSWENALKLNETQTRTPQLATFIKSADELALQSLYLYHLPDVDWLGPFARVAMITQVFSSYDVRGADVDIVRTLRDDTTREKTIPVGDHIQLAKPFEPILLKEGAGVFANPYTHKLVAVKTKLSLGMQHVIVRDGFALADDKDTPQLEIKQLEDSTQGGAEAEVELAGSVAENVSWGVKAGVFYPFFTTVATELSGVELMTTDVSAKLSVKLAKWASLDYVLLVKRVPLILDKWQVQNNVLFTAGFDII